MFTVSTMQVDDGRIELLNPNEMILRNTGKKPTASERLAAGAVQSELNSIFNTQLDVDGWYGGQSAGTVRDLQKELSLPATGVLDVQTFYQLQLAVESGASYKRSVAPVSTGASIKPLAGNTGPNYALSNVPGDYNGNRIPDQYEPYAQGTSYKASSGAGTNYALSNVPGDYNGNGIPDQYDSYAQGTGKAISNSLNISLADSLPAKGEPGSTGRLYNPDGSVKQERKYGPDGKAQKDTDYNHGGEDSHEFPHEHEWDWSKKPPRQKGVPVPTPDPAPIHPIPNPYSSTISTSSNNSWWHVPAGIGLIVVGGVATIVLVADDASGIGFLDDPAIAVTGGLVAKGFEMVFAR